MITEKIAEEVEQLPASLQKEVLDFVQYLVYRYPSTQADESEREFSRALLAGEMRALDDAEGDERVEYSLEDLT